MKKYARGLFPLVLIAGLISVVQASQASAATYGAPSAPQNVTQSSSGSGIALSWSAPASGAVSSYTIERSTNGTSWTTVGSTSSTSLTVLSGLSPSTSYYFRVAGISGATQGAYGYPWTKIYGTTSQTRDASGNVVYETGFGLGGSDAAATASSSFSRIRYRMSTTISGVAKYADVDFYKWSRSGSTEATSASQWDASIASIQIPSTNSPRQYVVHGNVSDLNVYSDNSAVTNGYGISGRLEIWPWNYATTNSGLSPSGNTSTYDYDDCPVNTLGACLTSSTTGSGTYGSFQVHDLDNQKPVFVWNRTWSTEIPEIAYGKNPTNHPDWTFCRQGEGSCPQASAFYFQIYVNSPITTAASLRPIISVSPAISGTTTYLETLTASTGTWSNTPTGYTYQWLRASTSGGTYSNIAGATTSNYRLTSSDVGQFLRVAVTATNTGGSTQDTSTATIAIAKANQSVTLSTLGTNSKNFPYTQALNMSTSGNSGTGAITYAIAAGGTATGCSLSDATSSATLTASSSGTCLISASIAADSNFNNATSSSLTFTFSRASQTLTFGTTSYSKNFNETQTVIATGQGSGAITYSAGASTACSVDVSTGIVTITSGSGTCSITASIAQDSNYNSANSSNSVTITVSNASSSSSITIASGSLVYRTAKNISATTSVAGRVTFRVNGLLIPGCRNLVVMAANSFTRTCSFRPFTRGFVTISVTLEPTNSSVSSSVTQTARLFVSNRSGTR